MPAPPPIVFGPSFASKHQRKPMDFTDTWGEGEIFAWYRRRRQQSKKSVLIDRLQIRIDNGTPPHRFVLAFMGDGSIYRFDRRPETSKVGALLGETLGPVDHRKAGDDCCLVLPDELPVLEKTTHREIEINLQEAENRDLLLILSAAFAIANDKETRKYNLATYNCYFFSWTIIMIVARHAIPFVIPSSGKVTELLSSAVTELASSVTDKIVDALLSLVLDTITTFRAKTGRSLNKGLSKRELMIWGLPTSTVRFLLKGCIKMRLNLGLEDQLQKVVHDQLHKHVEPLLEKVLTDQQTTAERVDEKLWIDQLMEAFGPPVRKQFLKIVWSIILEALAKGYADINAKDAFNNITTNPKIKLLYRLKYRLLGANVIQFTRVWNEALHDAIPAASRIPHRKDSGIAGLHPSSPDLASDSLEDEKRLHKQMFDDAFNAAAEAARNAAERVVTETAPKLKNPKRNEMWETVWGVWDEVWDSARDKAEGMIVDLITNTMTEIVDLLAKNVVAAIGNNEAQPQTQGQEDKLLSLSAFQTRITKHVRSVADPRTRAEAHLEDIQAAMTRAWIKSKQTYKPLDQIGALSPSK